MENNVLEQYVIDRIRFPEKELEAKEAVISAQADKLREMDEIKDLMRHVAYKKTASNGVDVYVDYRWGTHKKDNERIIDFFKLPDENWRESEDDE